MHNFRGHMKVNCTNNVSVNLVGAKRIKCGQHLTITRKHKLHVPTGHPEVMLNASVYAH